MAGTQTSLGCELLVCRDAGASPFTDDLKEDCVDCGRVLSFRPYLAEQSPKVCVACFEVRKNSMSSPATRQNA